jgi:hypothetical protein
LRLIRSIEPGAPIAATSEDTIIALRSLLISRIPLAGHQTEHDLFCDGYVFRALEN